MFQTVRVEFRDCFRTIRVEFLGLFSNSPDRIFRIVFGQSMTEFEFSFNPGTNVYEFCDVFWYHSNSVTNCQGPKGALFYVGPRFGPFCVLLL